MKNDHPSIVEQIFCFVAGSSFDQKVSCSSFLSAARTRWRRGKYRQLSILHMNKLAMLSSTLGATGVHLLGVVVSVMSQGAKLDDLECSGMLKDVREEYGVLLRQVVDQCMGKLSSYCEKVIVLATIPFVPQQLDDVLRSNLMIMLNKLTSGNSRDLGLLHYTQRSHAWKSFQLLVHRLVTWESDKCKYGVIEENE